MKVTNDIATLGIDQCDSTRAGLWTTAIVNSHLIKLMTNCGTLEQLLTSDIGKSLSHVSINACDPVIEGVSPSVKVLSSQLSVILKGEAQQYWNMILAWAHKAQFYEAFEKEAKRRCETG